MTKRSQRLDFLNWWMSAIKWWAKSILEDPVFTFGPEILDT